MNEANTKMTIRLNPEEITIKWTKQLNYDNISFIEKVCWKPMAKLGYANFSNQTTTLTDVLSKVV